MSSNNNSCESAKVRKRKTAREEAEIDLLADRLTSDIISHATYTGNSSIFITNLSARWSLFVHFLGSLRNKIMFTITYAGLKSNVLVILELSQHIFEKLLHFLFY